MALGEGLTEQLAAVVRAQRQQWEFGVGLLDLRALKATMTRTKLAAIRAKRHLRIATFQLDDLDLERNVPACDFPVSVELRNFDGFNTLCDSGFVPDLALYRSHQFWHIDGSYDLRALSEAPHLFADCLNLIWLWDHHHDFEGSFKMALLADVVLPMHETGADYLKIANDFVLAAVPAASAQWGGRALVHEVFEANAQRPRSDRLYGGFVEYSTFRRNDFIRSCMAAIPDHALALIKQVRDIQHFGAASRRERLIEWMGHKCSLVCALTADIPIRILDGLLAGQIPLVPHNLNGFDRLISPRQQRELPVVRYDAFDVASVKAAWQLALALYDRDGVEGAERRHRFVLEGHLMEHRVIDIVLTVLNVAQAALV